MSFSVSGFPVEEEGAFFAVLGSLSLGSYLLPFGDGRQTCLADDAFLAQTQAFATGLLSGQISEHGDGSTVDFVLPSGTPVGPRYFLAVSYMPIGGGGVQLMTISDVCEVEVF